MPKNLFRTPPSEELLQLVCDSIGINDLNDTRWFDETYLDEEDQQEVLREMERLYYPVHHKTYVLKEDFKYRDYITIVRQLLRSRGRKLRRKDKCITQSPGLYKYLTAYSIEFETTNPPHQILFE